MVPMLVVPMPMPLGCVVPMLVVVYIMHALGLQQLVVSLKPMDCKEKVLDNLGWEVIAIRNLVSVTIVFAPGVGP